MATAYHHSLASVRRWGGTVEDFMPLHEWLDDSKRYMGDFRHRALRHHAEGIFALEERFGRTITLSTGEVVPTRLVGEQHVTEDVGFIPSLSDWLIHIAPQPWMNRPMRLSRTLRPDPPPAPEE